MKKLFIEIAKRDIKTACLLFEMQRFPEAIYYLQQANEKIIKSFGIGLGIITEKEAKSKVSHYTYKFLNFFYLQTKKYSSLTYDNENNEKEDNKKIEKYLKGINNKFIDFNTDVLTEELEFVLNEDKFIKRLIKSITDIFGNSFLVNVSSAIILNRLRKQKYIKELIIPMFKMIYIGIILSNHNQSSRYPFKLKNKTIEPQTYYNAQNPLVKNYLLIEDIMKNAIIIVEKAIENKDLFEIKK